MQIFAYPIYAAFFLKVLPSWIELEQVQIEVSILEVAKAVGIYLGIPFTAGFISRFILTRVKSELWYERKFIPLISPLTLIALMFFLSFFLSYRIGADYPSATTLSFTAASNNFELAIAVAIATFGIIHGAAFAAVIGPLVEVPVLVGLVSVSLWIQRKYFQESKLNQLADARSRTNPDHRSNETNG